MAFRTRLRAGLLALVIAGAVVTDAAPTAAQTGDDLVEACAPLADVPEVGREIGGRTCGAIERGLWLVAQHCRRVPGLAEAVCPAVDGRDVTESAMQTFEASWAATALDLQGDLDRDVPLTDSLILHTHNSANSAAYAPSLSTNDANQVLTITDQLRLGIRGIELDVHWAPQPGGDPAQGFRAPVQCHGQSVATPIGAVHVGCSVDQPLGDLLVELRTWLDRPENEAEFVLLYLENVLDGDPAAHDAATALIEATIGDLVFRPEAGGGCQDLPVDRSKDELSADGARILLTGNCGPGAWTDLVFQRGAAWNESGDSTAYLEGSDCDTERQTEGYDDGFIRRWEDSTFLSLMANGGSYISPTVAASLVRCGVNMPGLDQLHAGDDRLPAFIWSWREQEPGPDADRACAAQGTDTRFGALECDIHLPVACRTTVGGWAVTDDAVPWADGDLACVDAGHVSAGVPANGWDNQLLRRAAPPGVGQIWLAYGRDDEQRWVTDIPAPPTDSDPNRPDLGRPDTPPKGPRADAGLATVKRAEGAPPTTTGPRGTGIAETGIADRRGLPVGLGALGVLLAILVVAPWRRRTAP